MSGAANSSSLLYHFHRHAAGQQNHAAVAASLAAEQRTGKLVERVVAADVFAHSNQTGFRAPNAAACTARVCRFNSWRGGSADSARIISAGVNTCHRQHAQSAEPLRSGCRCRKARIRSDPQDNGDACRARRRGDPSATYATRFQIVLDDFQLLDIGRRRDHAFGKGKAECKIFQIARCRHHHRIGAAVVGESDGSLLRDGAVPSVTPLWRHTVAATGAAGSRIRLLRRLGGRGDAPALSARTFRTLPASARVR